MLKIDHIGYIDSGCCYALDLSQGLVVNQTFFIALFFPVDELIKNIHQQDPRLLSEVLSFTLVHWRNCTKFVRIYRG